MIVGSGSGTGAPEVILASLAGVGGPVSPISISVCIVCRNEAAKLSDCLRSVEWADEVLVLDLESTDGSAEVARSHGATVLSRSPHPIVEPLRNELADRASGAWILALDPDERVTPGLAKVLRSLALRADIDAVVLPRMNVDFGWKPVTPAQRYEPQLRMYRRANVRWPEFPNRLPEVAERRSARVEPRDENVLEHLRNVDVAETTERLVRYPTAQAQAMIDEGREFSARAMFAELWGVGLRHFIRARAWREGMPGIARSVVLVNHHVYVWIAFWHLSGAARTEEDDRIVSRLGVLFGPVAWYHDTRARLGALRADLGRR